MGHPQFNAKSRGTPEASALAGRLHQAHGAQHCLDAVRAHLLERVGDTVAARESTCGAARMTASAPEQRYLTLRAARLHQPGARWRPGG